MKHGDHGGFREVPGFEFRVQDSKRETLNSKLIFFALLALLPACHKDAQHAPSAPELPELSRMSHAIAPRNGMAILLIPDDAIVTHGGISGVFTLRDGRARFQPVKLGRQTGSNVEVLAGLEGGEKLIGGKLADVRDGSPIRNATR
jgi:hypothetical protein